MIVPIPAPSIPIITRSRSAPSTYADAPNSLVKQSLVFCGVEAEASKARGKGGKGTTYISGKLSAMRQLVTSGKLKPPVLVFVQSKDRATQLYEALRFDGMSIDGK